MSLEDVTVDFSKAEWQQLNTSQRCLYLDVMLEIYSHLFFVGEHTLWESWVGLLEISFLVECSGASVGCNWFVFGFVLNYSFLWGTLSLFSVKDVDFSAERGQGFIEWPKTTSKSNMLSY